MQKRQLRVVRCAQIKKILLSNKIQKKIKAKKIAKYFYKLSNRK